MVIFFIVTKTLQSDRKSRGMTLFKSYHLQKHFFITKIGKKLSGKVNFP
jgi:hypothetical protein